MIPKIIHFTWFSGDVLPDQIQKCIDSWHQCMPEYEYILWDANRLKEIDSVWLNECLEKKKWAYAADMVRMYAVYKYGGIYLDTDCLVYRSFNPLLKESCFIGKENSFHLEGGIMENYLSSHCFGAEPGNEYIKRCYEFYCSRHFILSQDESLPMKLKWNIILSPFVQSELAKQYGYNSMPSCQEIQRLGSFTVFPRWYFDVVKQTADSYCKHLAMGSWREERPVNEKITIGYKIRWRIEAVVEHILNRFGYKMLKLM